MIVLKREKETKLTSKIENEILTSSLGYSNSCVEKSLTFCSHSVKLLQSLTL